MLKGKGYSKLVIPFLLLLIIAGIIFTYKFISNKDEGTSFYSNERIEIMFDKELNTAEIPLQGIVVKDSTNEETQVILSLLEFNNRIVNIYPPEGGYKVGETYTIYIDSNYNYTIEGKNENVKSLTFKAVKDKEIEFEDKNFEKAIRNQIGKDRGKLYISDVYKLRTLNAEFYRIRSIKGIEKLKALENLHLSDNEITDIKPIKELKNLRVLALLNNKITDISALEKLTDLQTLWIGGNDIKNYSPVKAYYDKLEGKDFQLSN